MTKALSDQVPNPSKVLIILEELGLPYQSIWVEIEDLKKTPFKSINPNGRVPGTLQALLRYFLVVLIVATRFTAIIDPNTNITLFESNAIVFYLISTYDKSHSLTYSSAPETFLLQQWLFFQASGQGPYYGQAAWYVH